jgi:hypothetical protein
MSSGATRDPSTTHHRVEVTLRRPWYGAVQRPTVVFDGRGQPAQWGTGSWQLLHPAVAVVDIRHESAGVDTSLVYHAPLLPFLPGRFTTS